MARSAVERLMKAQGLRGIRREKSRTTTIGDGAETERARGPGQAEAHRDRTEPATAARPASER